jgi:murein DD-endopeptidase MepM/ murein hydrolase activator NlpD
VAAVVAGIAGQNTTTTTRSATVEAASSTQLATPRQVAADVRPVMENPRRLAAAHRRATDAREHRERIERKARATRAKARAARAAERSRLAAMDPRDLARAMVRTRGWGADQFGCLDSLWARESGWDRFARNPSSGAYGIPQALPASKMASAGQDWRTNPATQIRWGLQYIAASYGSPCGAWGHSQSHGWY